MGEGLARRREWDQRRRYLQAKTLVPRRKPADKQEKIEWFRPSSTVERELSRLCRECKRAGCAQYEWYARCEWLEGREQFRYPR